MSERLALLSDPKQNKVKEDRCQSDTIRVLHIITRMIVGGAQENTLLSVVGLDAMREYDVTLISGIDKGREGEMLSQARQTSHLIVLPEMGDRKSVV